MTEAASDIDLDSIPENDQFLAAFASTAFLAPPSLISSQFTTAPMPARKTPMPGTNATGKLIWRNGLES
jgi:hypothetical protein